MDPGRTPSHRTDTVDVRVSSISIFAGHGLHNTHPGNDETLRIFKLPVCNTQNTMAAATRESREMSIKQLDSDTQWMQVWKYGLGIGRNRIHMVHRGT